MLGLVYKLHWLGLASALSARHHTGPLDPSSSSTPELSHCCFRIV